MAEKGQKPRVLILNSCVNGGGAGRSLLTFLNHDGNDLEIQICLPEMGVIGEQLTRGRKYHLVPRFVERIHRSLYRWPTRLRQRWLHIACNCFDLLRAMKEIAAICRREKIDAIYCNHMLAKPVGVMVGHWLKIPVVLHVRNVHQHWFGRRFYSYLGTKKVTKAIICNSLAAAAPYSQVNSDKIRIVPNAIDLREFRSTPFTPTLRLEFGLSPETVVIGYLGRILPMKGVDVLIRAFAKVRARNRHCVLAIVGDNDGGLGHDLRAQYEKMAAALGLAHSVLFAGFHKDVREALADFDILAFPSVTPESFGRVLLEAMALGVPQVISAHGGATEVVADNETGLYSIPGDADNLAWALEKLVLDPTLRREMAAAGRRRVERLYNAPDYARRVSEILAEAAYRGKPYAEAAAAWKEMAAARAAAEMRSLPRPPQEGEPQELPR